MIVAVLWPLACALCLLGMAGCEGTGSHAAVQNDPLLGPGGGSRTPAATSTAGGAAGTPTGPLSELPALPTPSPKISAASLAAGDRTGDAAPQLRIGSGPAPAAPRADPGVWRAVQGGSTPVTITTVPPALDPAATRVQGSLQDPIPIHETSPATPPSITVAGPAGATYVATKEQGIALLENRGATVVGPEQLSTGEWRFLCSIPDKNGKLFHRYEVTMNGDPVDTVRAVIQKIDADGR